MCVERIVSSTFLHMLNSNHVHSQRFPEVYTECYIRFLVFETSGCGVETSGIHFPRFRGAPRSDIVPIGAVRRDPRNAISRRAVIACCNGDSGCDTSCVDDVLLDTAAVRKLPPMFVSKLPRGSDRDLKKKRKKKIGKEEETELVVMPARDLSRSLSPYRAMHHKRTRNNLLHLVRIYEVSQRMRKLNSICSKSICMKCIFS